MTSDRPVDEGAAGTGAGADADALATATAPLFGESSTDRRIPRSWVASWALWDAGGAAFNAVITTFVFTVYLTSEYFISPALLSAQNAEKNGSGPAHHAVTGAIADLSSGLAWGIGIAGIVVAVLAPVLGRRTDGSGRRKLWLGINTGVVVVVTALMFFVVGEPSFFLFGVVLVGVGTVFYEIATVNYNAMLVQVSTPKTVGRVSGLGWASGYFGGILLLVIVLVLLASPNGDGTGGVLRVTTDQGLNYRLVAVVAAIWTLALSIPVLVRVPEAPANRRLPRVGFFSSYRLLFRDIAVLWRESRNTVMFLIASALFRDGLVGVFTFGGILAKGTFGFTQSGVIVFAIAANVVAGVSTILSGRFDDRFGAKPVIVTALIGLVIAGLAVFFLHDSGAIVFWVFGLILCLFVGPAQSASRTFLARITPAGREGEVFGLYATCGRAVSFVAPLLFATFVAVGGAQYWGILGIVLVLLVGLLLLLPVRSPRR